MKRLLFVLVLLALAMPAMAEDAGFKRETTLHISTPLFLMPGAGVSFDDAHRGKGMMETLGVQFSFWSYDNDRILIGKAGISLVEPGDDWAALSISPVCIRVFRSGNPGVRGIYIAPTYWYTLKNRRSVIGLQFSFGVP